MIKNLKSVLMIMLCALIALSSCGGSSAPSESSNGGNSSNSKSKKTSAGEEYAGDEDESGDSGDMEAYADELYEVLGEVQEELYGAQNGGSVSSKLKSSYKKLDKLINQGVKSYDNVEVAVMIICAKVNANSAWGYIFMDGKDQNNLSDADKKSFQDGWQNNWKKLLELHTKYKKKFGKDYEQLLAEFGEPQSINSEMIEKMKLSE